MINRPKILVFEPEAEVVVVMERILSISYTALFATNETIAKTLFDCGVNCYSVILVEGGLWNRDYQAAQKFINSVRVKGYRGLIMMMSEEPAYPYKRIGADGVVNCRELVARLSEILAKK